MFLISCQTGQWQTLKNLQLQWRKQFSRRMQFENTLCCWMTLTLREWIKVRKTAEVEFSKPFYNKFTKKSEGERFPSLKIYREDNNMQLMAKADFDFSMEDMIVLSYFSKREAI